MPQLYTTEHATVASYRAAREAMPDGVIPAAGEPYVRAGAREEEGLKVYARDGQNRTGWYYTAGDKFVLD